MRRAVISSRSTQSSVGREGLSATPSVVRKIDLSATLGVFFFWWSKALPHCTRRRLRAWRMCLRVTLLRTLEVVWSWDGVMSSPATKSFLCRIPREARSMGGGERSVRIGTRVFTSDHMTSWAEVSDVISSGWRASMLAMRRRGFSRLRMLSTSCRTDLG